MYVPCSICGGQGFSSLVRPTPASRMCHTQHYVHERSRNVFHPLFDIRMPALSLSLWTLNTAVNGDEFIPESGQKRRTHFERIQSNGMYYHHHSIPIPGKRRRGRMECGQLLPMLLELRRVRVATPPTSLPECWNPTPRRSTRVRSSLCPSTPLTIC